MISDMTKGNPLKLIISFSVPMLIGNIFQQVYNFVDAAIVGKFVGAESLAAVGSTGTIVGVMICLMMGLTSGAGIIIAQCFGSRNFDELRKTVTGLIYIVGILAVVTSVAGVSEHARQCNRRGSRIHKRNIRIHNRYGYV